MNERIREQGKTWFLVWLLIGAPLLSLVQRSYLEDFISPVWIGAVVAWFWICIFIAVKVL